MNTKEEILARATRQNGALAQSDMMIEESAELIQAINKMKRVGGITDEGIRVPTSKDTVKYCMAYNDLCGEVADVDILIYQMKSMLSGKFEAKPRPAYGAMKKSDAIINGLAKLILSISNLYTLGGISYHGISVPDSKDKELYHSAYQTVCVLVSTVDGLIGHMKEELRIEQIELIEERKLQRLKKRLLKHTY